MANAAGDEFLDVVVIGGSQAGLAIAWHLTRQHLRFVVLEAGPEPGHVIHRRGVTDVPGLYFFGLPWQHTRGSALLGFVHDDAAHLAGRIAAASGTLVLACRSVRSLAR